MYVTDTVEAALVLADNLKPGHLPVNVSSGERLRVSRIVELICEQLGVPDVITGIGFAHDALVKDVDGRRSRSVMDLVAREIVGLPAMHVVQLEAARHRCECLVDQLLSETCMLPGQLHLGTVIGEQAEHLPVVDLDPDCAEQITGFVNDPAAEIVIEQLECRAHADPPWR